jgi:very-short-patch-repair endonuclease
MDIPDIFKNFKNYGSNDNPLFRAKDLGDLLDIKKIRKTIESLDSKYKTKIYIKDQKGGRLTWLLSLDGVKRIIIISRKPKAIELCKYLNIDCDIKIITKEIQFITQIRKTFHSLNMIEQFNCLNYRIDLYFPDFNIAIEFDENHSYKNKLPDINRQKLIQESLKCSFIRVKYNDDIFTTINIILKHMCKL